MKITYDKKKKKLRGMHKRLKAEERKHVARLEFTLDASAACFEET